MMEEEDRPQFSVAVFLDNGKHAYIVRWVHDKAAVACFRRAIVVGEQSKNPPLRIIITDGGDCTVREWKRGEGITWPERM